MSVFEHAGETIVLASLALWATTVLVAAALAFFTNFWDVTAIPADMPAEQRPVDDLPMAA